jgi:hypothetical protein
MDLLTTYTHDSELQVITAPSLISTLYKSPQHPPSLFQAFYVFIIRSLATISNGGDSSAPSQSQSHIATDGQSVSKSWYRAPSWACDQIFFFWQLRLCFLWGALSDERTGLSVVYAAGSCRRSLCWVRVPWYSRPYITVSYLRLPSLAAQSQSQSHIATDGQLVWSTQSGLLYSTVGRTRRHLLEGFTFHNGCLHCLGNVFSFLRNTLILFLTIGCSGDVYWVVARQWTSLYALSRKRVLTSRCLAMDARSDSS